MEAWLSSEEEVLRRIVENKTALSSTIHFALSGAFPYPEQAFGQDVLVGINIPREMVNLSAGDKPGDIDLLVVPVGVHGVRLERTIAIEAKIIRPSLAKPGKNANKMGASQANGLLRAGFPFVGLVHIAIPERLPRELHWSVRKLTGRFLADGAPEEELHPVLVDPFPLLSSERQHGRLGQVELSKGVGYNVIALSLSKDGQGFAGNTLGDGESPLRNPNASLSLAKSVGELLTRKASLFKRGVWV